MGLIVNKSRQDRTLSLQVLIVDSRSQTYQITDACGIGKVIDVGIQLVPLEVVAQRCTPVGQQLKNVGSREIELLLLVTVINRQLCGVLVHVVGVVIGILGQPTGAEPLAYVHKGVQVLLAFASSPHVVYYGSWYSSCRVIQVAFNLPSSLIQLAKQVHLYTFSVYITILTNGSCVPSRLSVRITTFIMELVLSTGSQESCTYR